MTIDKFLHEDGRKNQIEAALIDYHSHEDYSSINTWDRVNSFYPVSGSVKDQGNGSDQNSKPDGFDEVDFLKSQRYLKKFFKAHKIEPVQTEKQKQHFFYYVSCPWEDQHTTEGNYKETFISIDKRSGMINFFCHHTHCDGKEWKEYRKFYEDRDGKEEKRHFDIKLVSGRELQKMNLPPIVYPVGEMIPEGYTVFSAPFKYGKSWFVLEMCLAISEGNSFIGSDTQKGASVYMALEDCNKFAQERLNIALQGREAPEGFYYIYESVPTLDDGFIAYLDQLYEMIPNLKLIVIDVLAKIEYQPKRGESAYKCDYRTGGDLKKWADGHQVSIIAVTHTTKHIYPDDVFMNTSGTNGVTGSADAILTIAKKNRAAKEGVLAITGRRVREKYLQVELKDGWRWISDGEVDPETMKTDEEAREQAALKDEYLNSPIREAVIQIAERGENTPMCASSVKDKAREYNLYLLDTAKAIGLFLHKHQNRFTVEDGVKVEIIKNGSGATRYRFQVWDAADEETKNKFDK